MGWNTPAAEIRTRAKEVLARAGVKESEYVGLDATRQSGSLAELCFHNPDDLQKARLGVRSLRLKYVDDKAVWLDVKKSLKPARVVHRVAEMLSEAEAVRENKMTVQKIMTTKHVQVGADKAGFVCGTMWIWTSFARARYTQDFLDMAKTYAESE